MYTTIGNKEQWRKLAELFVPVASVQSWTSLSLITRTEEVVRNGEKARKEWQTVYSRVREKLTTLKYCVDYVMLITTSNLKINLLYVSVLNGLDVIVQRYCDYTNNTTIKKNGQEITWQKK